MGGQLDRSSKKPNPYVVPGTRAPRGTAPERNGARGGDRAGGFKGHSGWRACGRAGGGRQNAVESHPLSQPTRMLHCCGTHLHYRTAPPFTPPKSKFFLLSVAQNVAQSFRYTSLWRSHLYTSQDLFNAYEQCHVCFSTDKQTYQQKHSSPFRATSWGLHGQASPAAVFLIGCQTPQFRLLCRFSHATAVVRRSMKSDLNSIPTGSVVLSLSRKWCQQFSIALKS